MSSNERDQLIVIHPPLNGEVHAIADVVQEDDVTTVVLVDPTDIACPLPSAPPARERSKSERAVGVDAYRGFFLLVMTFAMAIPMAKGLFPEWMYHFQDPYGNYVDRAGIAWRDITFPAFLFTMCAAIPITNSLRLAKGMPYPGILWGAVKRFALLTVYALVIGNVNPYWTQDYTKRGNLVAIAGFLALWPLFTRKPEGASENTFRWIKRAGWAAAAAIIFVLPHMYGRSFSMERADDIIRALAFVSLVTIPIWLFTQKNPVARLAFMALAVAVKLANDHAGPAQDFINNQLNFPVLYQPWMVELLLIAIPGTLAGDLIVRWMRAKNENASVEWSRAKLSAMAALCFSFAPVAVVGYYNHFDTATGVVIAALAAAGVALVQSAKTEREVILRSLFRGAAALMVAGAALVPFDSIKKDPQTFSYLIFMSGLALSLLTTAIILVDVLKVAKRTTKLVVQVGQNPLLAYVSFMLFFNHIAWLFSIPEQFRASPAMAIVGCTVFAGLTGALAVVATRKKLFWRA